MKVLVGISGGPRSMVTAWLLKKQGMQVRGVHLDLFSSEKNRAGIHEIEKKLGIQIQVLDSAKDSLSLFLEENASSLESGYPFSAKRVFQKKILFPELLRIASNSGVERIATGHMVGLQDDPVSNLVRMVRTQNSEIEPLIEVMGLSQDVLRKWIAPIGAIPKTLLEKLKEEVAPEALTHDFGLDWGLLESKIRSSDPALLARELQVFTSSGVLLGRTTLGSLKIGQVFQDPEDASKDYRVIEIQPKVDRAVVQDVQEISMNEFHFEQIQWFTGPDLGMGFLDVGMVSEKSPEARLIRLIQYEGERLKGLVQEPFRGHKANILKGDSVIFVRDSEVLGGAQVMKAR